MLVARRVDCPTRLAPKGYICMSVPKSQKQLSPLQVLLTCKGHVELTAALLPARCPPAQRAVSIAVRARLAFKAPCT